MQILNYLKNDRTNTNTINQYKKIIGGWEINHICFNMPENKMRNQIIKNIQIHEVAVAKLGK